MQKPTCASTQVKFLSAPSLALAEANRKKSLVLVSHWVLRRHSAAKGTEDGHLKTKLRSIKRYKIMPLLVGRVKAGRDQIHIHFVGYLSASRHPMRWSKGGREMGRGITGIRRGDGLALSHREMLQNGRTLCSEN